MPVIDVFNEYGEAVGEDDLEFGDVVFDSEGNAFEYVEDDGADDSDEYYEAPEGQEDFDPQAAEYYGDDYAYGKSEDYAEVSKIGMQSLRNLRTGFQGGKAGTMGGEAGPSNLGRAGDVGAHLGKHRKKYAVGGGLAGAGAVGGMAMSKSLSDVVLEELSKADSEDARNEIIAKAMQETELARQQAAEAWEAVAKAEDDRLREAFISKAAEYNLPVDPVTFGEILKAASTVLDSEQLDLLDGLFSSIGDALYDEYGNVGDTDNGSVMDVVDGYVEELIGKADATPEMITTAVFDANPEAYDEYVRETGR